MDIYFTVVKLARPLRVGARISPTAHHETAFYNAYGRSWPIAQWARALPRAISALRDRLTIGTARLPVARLA